MIENEITHLENGLGVSMKMKKEWERWKRGGRAEQEMRREKKPGLVCKINRNLIKKMKSGLRN